MNLVQYKNELELVYQKIRGGDMSCLSLETNQTISYIALFLINKANTEALNELELNTTDIILQISNIIYNNTSLDILPLDDGLYDQLIVIYKKYDENYQIGATPVNFTESPQNEFEQTKIMATCVNTKDLKSKLYAEDIIKQYTKTDPRLITMCSLIRDPIKKRIINTPHKYPELVGTLDKCKFVLNNDAIEKGVFDKLSVDVFERDFIQKHLAAGIINTVESFEMVAELKYDGISVEADICGDTILSARSRGDTGEDIATDLTPILGGYKFPNAKSVPKDITFGIKFEAVITKYDLERMAKMRNKSYKNCRNAIIGLFGSSDAYHFKDFITLIPLATSLDMPRLTELQFLNNFYNSGQYNRYVIFRGNYQQILFHVKQFTDSAELIRKVLPYLIDGVVISYTDKNIINKLGRENSVNKYSMAIKFNPKKVRTTFLGYSYSIGKSGDVIPMVHFKPCEFIGTIHDKTTAHSYQRFKDLQLHRGDQVDIEYRNEVICYITKPDTEFNRNTKAPLEEFITTCPYCGSKIVISDSGKSAKCINVHCPERETMRAVAMIDRLGFKDFSEETIRALNIKSLKQLLNITQDQCNVLGPISSNSFMSQVNSIKTNPIYDYKVMAALNFENMAAETWKLILNKIYIKDILESSDSELYNKLISIHGIGEESIKALCRDRKIHQEDLDVVSSMSNIISTLGLESGKKVTLSGFRDHALIELLNENGFSASETNGVTKDTYCLIVQDKNSQSSKVVKANKFNIPIKTPGEFLNDNNIKV